MKRFFSLALALCLSVSLFSVTAFAAPTSTELNLTGKYNQALKITAADFIGACGDAELTHVTITALPSASDGKLVLGGADMTVAGQIPVASLTSFSFQPKPGFTGVAEFTWTGTDVTGESAPADAKLTFDVDAPVALDAEYKLLVDASMSNTLQASDPQDLPLTYSITKGPAKGDLTFSVTKGTFTYTPDDDFEGTDTVEFHVTNSKGKQSNTATVTFKVGNVKAPTAQNLSIDVTMNDSVIATLTGIDANDPPLSLTYSIVTMPVKGSITSFDKNTGKFTYKHNSGKLGSDSFTFRASNGYVSSNIATVTVDIKTPAPLNYRDMDGHWAKFSAGTLAVLDLAVGEQFQNMYYYHPNKTLTRAEYVIFLNSIMDVDLAPSGETSVFADVTDAYLIRSLNAAYKAGITGGTEVGSARYFYPNKQITRIEAMKMLDNVMKFAHNNNNNLTFTDMSQIPDWAVQSVKNLVGYKIVSGSGGYLRPLDLITRAETAQMLYLAYLERNS